MTTPPSGALSFGPFRLHLAQRLLLDGDDPVRLGGRAFDLLRVLVARAGEVVSKEELLAAVWGQAVVDEGSVRVHLAALRKALGDGQHGRRYITSVPMRGYCFVAPLVPVPEAVAPGDAPPPMAVVAPAVLPPRLTRLIGRDTTVDGVTQLLGQRRLVTLVGPGGIGKTQVALAAAGRLQSTFSHGARFVDLAPLTDSALVPSTLAAELGVPVLSDDVVAGVLGHLQNRPMLIVLDNCEHVVAAAAALAEALLRHSSGVKVLATSREPLRAEGEWILRVGGLAAPWDSEPATVAEALAFPAIELLAERVASTLDGFELADDDVPTVARICRALDGIPLAIELAATHAPTFGLRGLASLLTDRLSLLTQGRRTALSRHQTLRATLDWSHGLLPEAEQVVLRRLAVFRGSFALEAAVAVAVCPVIARARAVEGLVNLVNKSLVVVDGSRDTATYRLLETTRSYASQRLADSGERAAVLCRHAELVLAATLPAEDAQQALGLVAWRSHSSRCIDDVRAVLDWALSDGGDPALGTALVAASPPLWFSLGLVKEFRGWLDRAEAARPLLAPDDTRDLQLALAHGHAYLHTTGPSATTDATLRRALDIALRMGRSEHQLRAMWSLYTERMVRGDYAATLALARQFGEVSERSTDPHAGVTHHRMMAMSLHMAGDHAAAREHAATALRAPDVSVSYVLGTAYQVDHRVSLSAPLARILWIQGRPDEAAQVVADAVARATAVDHGFSMTYSLALAACPVAFWSGDLASARHYTDLLRDCSARHTLEFWQSWGEMYHHVLAWWPSRGDADWAARFAQHAGRADMLGTLHGQLLRDSALVRLREGRNAWCAAELMRADTHRAWRNGTTDPASVGGQLQEARALARRQGALAWELRATMSLGEWLAERADVAQAQDLLGDVLVRFRDGGDTADLRSARAQLARLAA